MSAWKNAMLVTVNVKHGGLLGQRIDKEASATVSNTYSASSKQVKAAKYLINRQNKKVKAVVSASQRIRDLVYKYTFPWGDSNLRMLPVKAHKEFTEKLNTAIRDFWDTVSEYETHYPYLVEDSKQNLTGLGLLFDPAQYPPQDKIKSLFTVNVEYWPIPESGHFVADVAKEAADEARKALTELSVKRANEAVNNMLHRIEETVGEFVEKLAAYKKTDEKIIGIFRDSTVENVAEMARLVKSLNFSDDASLDNLAGQVARLARATADALRDDPTLRESFVNEGKTLIARLDGYRKTDSVVDSMIDSVNDYYQQ